MRSTPDEMLRSERPIVAAAASEAANGATTAAATRSARPSGMTERGGAAERARRGPANAASRERKTCKQVGLRYLLESDERLVFDPCVCVKVCVL